MTRVPSRPPAREAFLAPFVAAGCTEVEPPVLQPAEVFLDLSGEDLAKRLYLTSDAEGRELCLRPEMTIPVCLAHMVGGDPARPAAYCYFGPVFRHRPGEAGEFLQAGVEVIGRSDTASAEAEVFALARDALVRHGIAAPQMRVGDSGLFHAVLAALDLPAAWRRRLARDFGRQDRVAADLASLDAVRGSPAAAYAGVLGALTGVDRTAARALVEDLLRIGALTTVGGRSAGEIADRFLEQAELDSEGRVDPERLVILRDVLAVEGPLAAILDALSDVTAPIAAAVAPVLETIAHRERAFAAAGIPLDHVRFDAGFGRRLDYYTGLVFEMNDPARPQVPALVGGGRFDGLLHFLGAPAAVPAVGFSVWVDRLPGAGP